MWPDEQKTFLIIENTDQETVCVTLWREQKTFVELLVNSRLLWVLTISSS